MDNTQLALQSMNPNNVRSMALGSSNPFDALYGVNPELGAVAYANREGLLSSEIMPSIANFRQSQAHERVALIQGLVDKYRADVMERVSNYQVDGQVDMTEITQRGMTTRTRIEDSGLTQRTQMQLDALEKTEALKYEANVKMLKDQINGQKYISDNELKARHIEAKAIEKAMIKRTEIVAQAQKRISKDGLEEAVRTAAIDYAKEVRTATIDYAREVQKAEIERGAIQDKNRAQVVETYVKAQTALCLAAYQMYFSIIEVRARLSEKEQDAALIREGLDTIDNAVFQGPTDAKLKYESKLTSFSLEIHHEKIVG